MNIGYGLRAEYAENYLGGVLATSDGDFNVAEELEAGGGVITVDDGNHELVLVLDEYPALKRVGAPDDADPITRYDRMDRDTLRGELRGRNLPTGGRVEELRERLIAADTLATEGDPIEPDELDNTLNATGTEA